MAVIPSNRLDQIQFCENILPVWVAAPPAAIGLLPAQVADLNTATGEARAAYNAAESARLASKNATANYYNAVSKMRNLAADYVRTVKAFAELQTDPTSIYALAGIPQPAPPSPQPAPGQPERFLITLERTGAVTLSWEAQNAAASSGAFFTVSRKNFGDSAFTVLGSVGGSTTEQRRMAYTDGSVPSSAAGNGVIYLVQGRRGTAVGPESDAILVQFGVDGNGARTVSVSGGGAQVGQPAAPGLKVAA